MLNYDDFFSLRSSRVKSSIIRELLKLGNQPGIISLGGGLPDPALFPIKEFQECMNEALNEENGPISLQYGETPGYQPLKESLIEISKKDGITNIDMDNLLVTTASQQGISLLSQVFLEDGDIVITEKPTYLSAIQSFKTFGATFECVSIDQEGASVEELEEILIRLKKEGKRIKFFYTIPTFQNPGGVCMSLERRKKVIALAKEYGFVIVEDNPYGDLRYKGDDLPCLKSLDTTNEYVVYLRTFSKILAPGNRLGWIVGPKAIIAKVSLSKQAVDLCSPVIIQMATDIYLRKGYLWPHIEEIRKSYSIKCQAMLDAVAKYFPADTKILPPDGGMFLWCSFPEYIDTQAIFTTAVEKYQVAYIPGSAFFPDGTGQNTARLNFTKPSIEQIDEGIKRLGAFIKEEIAKHG
ncbi:MAG: PLP-dependent aminotransferase family protein [Caldisericia bacterium]|nr:PLP-dependent aminotransferase family protein [Caldisericia bacterium]MDD4614550.1 PLP-dependent aminotransferase family protein [Caldisericia bacterium]